MGAWGTGYFDNDMACDCWAELKHEKTENALDQLLSNLKTVAENNSYIENDETESIIVCSLLIIMFSFNNWINEMFNEKDIPKYIQEEINQFLIRYQKDWDENYKNKRIEIGNEESKSLTIPQLANLSLQKVLNPKISEACELWEETNYYDEWKQRIQILIDKLEKM